MKKLILLMATCLVATLGYGNMGANNTGLNLIKEIPQYQIKDGLDILAKSKKKKKKKKNNKGKNKKGYEGKAKRFKSK